MPLDFFKSLCRRNENANLQHRTIKVNQPVQPYTYASNSISTSKYTYLTFLPKFLFEQFSKYSNMFFFLIVLLQQVPDVSPTGRFTTLVPLLVILGISAIKEIIEDFKRRKSDHHLNNMETLVFRSTNYLDPRWEFIRWKELNVGDIVKVKSNELFPADLLLLSTSEPNSTCYLQTSNLDGETNLKIRQGLSKLSYLVDSIHLRDFLAEIECENPNQHLYEFSGNIRLETDHSKIPLGPDQILLRGSKLQNTKWIYGVVIYTGHDTKLMMNSNKPPFKRSQVDKTIDKFTLLLVAVLLIMSIFTTIVSQVWINKNSLSHWYIGYADKPPENIVYLFITFFILFYNIIPISLHVTLEVVKFIQAYFINWDVDMFDYETGFAAVARTSNLNEELGQVKYIFSDKTGTLTCNKMQFKQCSIGGICYGANNEADFNDFRLLDNLLETPTGHMIDEFLSALATCHTVIPEQKDDSEHIEYHASSPDESALLNGIKRCGIIFKSRNQEMLSIKFLSETRNYKLLNVLEFNSDRKRMSVVVKDQNNKIKLYCKGADNVVLERALRNETTNSYIEDTLEHLENFARDGLRTLVLAYRELTDDEYQKWNKLYHEAATSMQDRDKKVQKAAEEIEKNLIILGATAIEDKLQFGVTSTINKLKMAGIKIWVLTGDKIETAVNIGYSCGLLTDDINLVYLIEEKYSEIKDKLRRFNASLGFRKGQDNSLSLIIDGKALIHALSSECQADFLDLATSCRSVICCRATPKNKAQLVEFIKRNTDSITLAVGDGANDVSMIQAAHVGVGIYGREGTQALSASDYCIGQFRFLTKLILVHGIWNYKRLCKVILYCYFKNIFVNLIEFWFAFYNAFSGQILFEKWLMGFYNVLFTAAPPLALGIFDRPFKETTILKFPQLYKLTQNKSDFNLNIFLFWMLNTINHSFVVYQAVTGILEQDVVFRNGQTGGIIFMGIYVLTYCIIIVCLKAGLETDSWTIFTHLSIWGSISFWFVFLIFYSSLGPRIGTSPEMLGMDWNVYRSSVYWLGIIFVPFFVLLPEIVLKTVQRSIFKTEAQQIQENELNDEDREVEKVINNSKLMRTGQMIKSAFSFARSPHRTTNMSAYRGFAFSQEENGPVRPSQLVKVYDVTFEQPIPYTASANVNTDSNINTNTDTIEPDLLI